MITYKRADDDLVLLWNWEKPQMECIKAENTNENGVGLANGIGLSVWEHNKQNSNCICTLIFLLVVNIIRKAKNYSQLYKQTNINIANNLDNKKQLRYNLNFS